MEEEGRRGREREGEWGEWKVQEEDAGTSRRGRESRGGEREKGVFAWIKERRDAEGYAR